MTLAGVEPLPMSVALWKVRLCKPAFVQGFATLQTNLRTTLKMTYPHVGQAAASTQYQLWPGQLWRAVNGVSNLPCSNGLSCYLLRTSRLSIATM